MKKLKVKDLINTALFSVILMVMTFAIGMIGFIPQTMPFFGILIGLITGTVWMLYLSKVNGTGQYFITCVLFMILFASEGHGIYVIPCFLIVGVIGELILKKGNYNSIKYNKWAATVFPLGFIGAWLPVFTARKAYLEYLIKSGYGEEYAKIFDKVLPPWAFPFMVIGSIIGMYIGCLIGIKILHKHFEKAGII